VKAFQVTFDRVEASRARARPRQKKRTYCLVLSSFARHSFIHSFISFFYPRARGATPVRRGEQRGRPSRQLTHPARHRHPPGYFSTTNQLKDKATPLEVALANNPWVLTPTDVRPHAQPRRPHARSRSSLTLVAHARHSPVPWPRWKYWKSSATTASWGGTPSIDVSRWVLNSTDARSDAKTRSSLDCTTLASSLTRASTML